MKVSDLFELRQGNGFELMHIDASDSDDSEVNFVSRTAQNNGVVARVNIVEGIEPFPKGSITVALGGSVLSSFVQINPFYTAFHIMVLEPKTKMSLQEKLYYCMCIKANAYRYSYGRQANKTLKDIELPMPLPKWVFDTSVEPIKTTILKNSLPLNAELWCEYELQDIFDIKYGINLELVNCEISNSGGINFVSRTATNNGVVAQVKPIQNKEPQKAGLISCSGGGSVLSTFVKRHDFYSGRDLYVLIPKYPMSIYSKLFCCNIIEKDKYRFNYGRQANKTLPILKIKLPCLPSGEPDFDFMENYIKSLPYSDRL
jgi:hypothetical protein